MEDNWIYIEDDEDDSYHSASDSDVIDSETEAELYSTIHYEENLNSNNTDGVNFLTFKLFDDSNSEILPPKENVFSTIRQEKRNIQLMDTSGFIANNLDSVNRDKKSPNENAFLNNELKQGLNPAKKIKLRHIESVDFGSDSSKDRNLNELSKHMPLNNIRNEICRDSSYEKQPSLKGRTSPVDSSDSDDNIIWAAENSSEKADFKTNVLKDVDGTTFLCSSDTDNELCISPSFRKRESILKNLSMPNIKMGENYEGLWHINDEDLYRQRKYSRRYHDNFEITCTNCNRKGHSFRTCTLPKKIKCFICGGAHLGSICMNRMCRNCYDYGHDSRRCRIKPKTSCCSLCSIKGHFMEDCPDLWRRYHLTTQSAKIVKAKTRFEQDSTSLYCWNCGDRGHFGALCHIRHSRSLTTWPCVVSYTNPEKLLRRRVVDNRKDDHIRWKERVKKGNFHNSRRNYVHLNQNELNATDNANEGKRLSKRGRRRRKRMDMRFNRVIEILGEHDFPRTPKQEVSNMKSEVPESVQLMMKRKQKQKKRRNARLARHRLQQEQEKLGANAQNLQVAM